MNFVRQIIVDIGNREDENLQVDTDEESLLQRLSGKAIWGVGIAASVSVMLLAAMSRRS